MSEEMFGNNRSHFRFLIVVINPYKNNYSPQYYASIPTAVVMYLLIGLY